MNTSNKSLPLTITELFVVQPKDLNINELSPHLFWDVDRNTLSFIKDQQFIIGRVLQYGLLQDWLYVNNVLGIEKITDIALHINNLDPKSLAFLVLISKRPKENFKCYSSIQSKETHWDY